MQGTNYSDFKYCPNCGVQIGSRYTQCPNCGAQQAPMNTPYNTYNNNYNRQQSQNSERWLIALLLCWFLGYFGAHRFYTGSIGIGLIQLFTLGGCGIWWIIDFILIIANQYRDSNGYLLK